ncbi:MULTISPECIES: hypothetical protein [Cyanophyceae]|nr:MULTISPECIES: hypothetical protein [Cyanophyceae]
MTTPIRPETPNRALKQSLSLGSLGITLRWSLEASLPSLGVFQ